MARRIYTYQSTGICPQSIETYINKQDSKGGTSIRLIAPLGQSADVPVSYPTLGEYAVSLCRHYALFSQSRVTVLSHEDSLEVLQLCLVSRNKENGDNLNIDSNKVIEYHNKIVTAKLISSDTDETSSQNSVELLEEYNAFLTSSSHVDMTDIVLAIRREMKKDVLDSDLQKELATVTLVLLGKLYNRNEKLLLEEFCKDSKIGNLSWDCTADVWQTVDFVELPTLCEFPVNGSQKSIQQEFVSRIVLAYLHILVNSRSELILSRLFNIPDRELTHSAFTALKHEARKKKMSMFQTATSFLLRIRMGYASNIDNPLGDHVKGFGELVTLVQQLQTVTEDDLNTRSACLKVVNIVKNRLVKCPKLKLNKTDVETASAQMYERITDVIDDMEKEANSPDKPASEGGSMQGRRCLRVIQLFIDKMAASQGEDNSHTFLEDIALNPKTPTRIPNLVSQFRSPDLVINVDENADSPNKTISKDVSKFACDNSEVVLPCGEKMTRKRLNTIIVLPSKTIEHACPETEQLLQDLKPAKRKNPTCSRLDKENIAPTDITCEQESKRQRKTVASSKSNHVTLAVGVKSRKKKTENNGCRRRLLPQVKGQQQLTGFFRV